MSKNAPPEQKYLAREMYLKGMSLKDIGSRIDVTLRTLYNWRENGAWDDILPLETVEVSLSRRINALSDLDKTPDQLKEYEVLVTLFGNLRVNLGKAELLQAQATAINKGRALIDIVPNDAAPPRDKPKAKRKDKAIKNDISSITPEMLDEVREKLFFGYQKLWYERRYDPITRRVRIILKSRQIGATYYFAFEALDNAIRTGDNQIFLSASRDQAEVFKAYIIAFAQQHFDVELKGQSVILLSNGAELRFLSTNSSTSQSYHGHLYIDEMFWIANYKKLNKVASGMAAQKKWTKTYFSTPSAISHQAYAEWSGELYNKGKDDDKRVDFDVSHANLKDGCLGVDKKWRHIVTIEDAEAQGCDLFDIEELKLEYSDDDFDNLFMCKFIDDSQSVFSLAKLLACTIDIEAWKDYHPDSARPYANKPVALGYDPSRTRDNASLAVLAVPLKPTDAWRVLDTKSYHGQNFQFQANRIKDVKESHQVIHIGIDTTGIGHGVYELVQDFFPLVTPIHYSMDIKTGLVVKALDVIENGRFEYLAGDHEITRAFLMITKTTTGSGLITYASSRSAESGHADIAWSIMHALIYEPINNNRRSASATFSS